MACVMGFSFFGGVYLGPCRRPQNDDDHHASALANYAPFLSHIPFVLTMLTHAKSYCKAIFREGIRNLGRVSGFYSAVFPPPMATPIAIKAATDTALLDNPFPLSDNHLDHPNQTAKQPPGTSGGRKEFS